MRKFKLDHLLHDDTNYQSWFGCVVSLYRIIFRLDCITKNDIQNLQKLKKFYFISILHFGLGRV